MSAARILDYHVELKVPCFQAHSSFSILFSNFCKLDQREVSSFADYLKNVTYNTYWIQFLHNIMTYQTLCLFYLPKPSLDLGVDISWYHTDLTQKPWPQGLFEVNAVCLEFAFPLSILAPFVFSKGCIFMFFRTIRGDISCTGEIWCVMLAGLFAWLEGTFVVNTFEDVG